MEKRGKKMPYEVVIQERKRVDLYGNVVYYIHWFDKYGYNITNEWKFWSKGPNMTLGDYDNTGENEQVAYFINYCLNQDKDGKE